MSDSHLDDLLRALGDLDVPTDRTAGTGRVRDRLDRQIAADRAQTRRVRGPRLAAVVLASLATAATFTAAAAVALTAATGSPVPGFARGDTTNVFPDPGTSRVSSIRATDPGGGPAWGVRIGRTSDGLVCVGTGQIAAGGAFGVRGLDGRFRSVAPFGNDPCGPSPRPGKPLVQLRGFSGPSTRSATGAVSVVYGSGGPDLRDVAVSVAGGPARSVRSDAAGTFVLAKPGFPEGVAPVVRLTWDDGTRRTVVLGRSGSVPDPEGRVGWVTSTAFDGPAGCVMVSVLRIQRGGPESGELACGPLTGRQVAVTPVDAIRAVGRRRVLLVRRDDGDRIVARLDGRALPLMTVRMAGRLRDTTTRTLERDRTGRRRMVERTVRLPGPGPTASVAILPAGARVEQLDVHATRDGRARRLAVDQVDEDSRTMLAPNGGR